MPPQDGPVAATLPAAVRPRPHHPFLRRTADSVQLGMAHRDGVEVIDLSAPLWRLVELLVSRAGWRVAALVERGVTLGADPDEVRALLAELYAQGALLDDGLARRIASARRAAYVLVEGSGPLTASVVLGLGAAGVGRLAVRPDRRPERPSDTAAQLREQLGRLDPPVTLLPPDSPAQPDLVVFADALAPDRGRHFELAATRTPHLVVRVCDGIGLVGPMVLPGRTSCLRCLDLHRTAADPLWPALAAQLASLDGSASPATVQASAALAVEQALLGLDASVAPGAPPPTLDAVLELELTGATLRRQVWAPHPDCGCGAGDNPLSRVSEAAATSEGTPLSTGPGTPDVPGGCVPTALR